MIKKRTLFRFVLISSLSLSLSVALFCQSSNLENGRTAFEQNCSACHNFRQDGIGPQLGGLAAEVSQDWLLDYIKDPKSKIDSGDKRAVALFKKYKVLMPGFSHLPGRELTDLVAYIYAQEEPKKLESSIRSKELADPIPAKIKMSDLVLKLETYTEIPFSGDKKLGTRIAKMDFHPATHENYILDLRGKLYRIGKDGKPEVYLDMAAYMPKFINQPGLATGFGSFAFHPEFAQNGLFYTTHTEAPKSAKADFAYADSIRVTLQWVISEWKLDPTAFPLQGTHRELFRVNMVSGIHGVQEISFNPNAKKGDQDYGLLYIGVGDGGSVESGFPFIPHNKDHIWGTILRIDPAGNNSANGNYGIPISNPFVKTGGLGEIYAMGFRNPHRFTWTQSGQMLAINIGQRQIESLNLILPGNDYGWPLREGTFAIDSYSDLNRVYALPKGDKKYKFTYPVAQFDHDEAEAITGGFEYLGNEIPELKGKYIFGSISSGRLFYVEVKDLKQGKQAEIKEWQMSFQDKITNAKELTGNNSRVDLRFGRDHTGEMYLFTKPDGKVYKLRRY